MKRRLLVLSTETTARNCFSRVHLPMVIVTCAVGCLLSMQGCYAQSRPAVSHVKVLKTYPHDSKAFTQGLVIDQGRILEGTGRNGESELRLVDPSSGRVITRRQLDQRVFGEGIAIAGDELFQLSWQNKIAFVYDRNTLDYKRRVQYTGEGWGLTFDGQSLIMSDGSSVLRFYDPQTFALKGRVSVLEGRRRVGELNELEFIKGEVWANIWHTDRIARIDPVSGQVTGWIDIASLKPAAVRFNREAVANGIAYEESTGRLLMTGKYWPVMYEVELVP